MSNPAPTYQYTDTQDWFSFNVDTWRNLFQHITSPNPRVLEIGSWEGRSAVFLLNEVCGDAGELVCIDHFDLMNTEAGRERRRKLAQNLSLTGKHFRIIEQFSVPALISLLTEETTSSSPGFDWIYIDGSHEADDTFLDGELAWRLARKGAVVIFDDYHWDKEPEDSVHHPKRGIDAFLALHAGEYTRLSSDTQYQVILQKTTEMRIGFLVHNSACSQETAARAFGYGINVALTIDEEYAIAAAVVIRSAAMHTRGRITFYVVGQDLSGHVKDRLRQSISDTAEHTIVFINLPSAPPSTSTDDGRVPDGMTWGKIKMIPLLPVERVLYLDADVLVCGDLTELWETDLGGKLLAAATDVGWPMGYDGDAELGLVGVPYFNAGVLLVDLAAIRSRMSDLQQLGRRTEYSTFRDQDALNLLCRGEWHPLSLKWNAQGLGTYALAKNPERAQLPLEEMNEPAVVHFTGPLHPSVADVLNPFVQPYGAKPWGYAGAPGHPFAGEWWKVCEETSWRGWRTSAEYQEQCVRKMNEALAKCHEAFRKKVDEERCGNDKI
ncbi:glycosyl transferase [Daedaleopsis nitida]|nr:glycosyl transferase [Daedaleopsis nitida]